MRGQRAVILMRTKGTCPLYSVERARESDAQQCTGTRDRVDAFHTRASNYITSRYAHILVEPSTEQACTHKDF